MMKKTLSILIVLLYFAQANATNYYLSSSSGNDQSDGNTANTAWQTISKLGAALGSLQPGDSVFFKCNDTFPGQLILSKSGSAEKYIYFGSFGSGKKPIISGTSTVSNWTQTVANIWQATCTDCVGKVTSFFINDIPQQIGRWPNVTEPNKGYLTYESHSGTNQITDNELTKATDWTGAEAVVRRTRWILDRLIIKTHNTNTLLFTTDVSYAFMNGFGYFIQNDLKTLDQQGEWYYNPGTKKFSLYTKTDPNTFITKATRLDNLIKISGLNYITIENLHFYGSGKLTMEILNTNYLTVRNNDITYSGENAVDMRNSHFVIFENNLINHTSNNAFTHNDCNNFVMQNNIIKNTALIAGMGLGADGQYNAVAVKGKNLLIEYNVIDSVGYLGMSFKGDSMIIKNNLISNYCMTKDDGGGLYTYGSESTINYSRKLIGNILLNAIGAPEGSGSSGVAAEGIYIDDRSANVDIINNSVYNCGNSGIFIHNANHVGVKGNTVYDNGIQLLLKHDNIATTYPITNCAIDSNIFVSKEAGQLVSSYSTIDNGISEFGTFDYNYYCRPLDDKLVISLNYTNGTKITEALTLENWRLKYNKDQHSGKSPVDMDEYKVNSVVSSNYFLNSAFESNTDNWTSWANYSNSNISVAQGEGKTGNALKAKFSFSSGKTDGYMIICSNQISLTAGKSYRLKFSARSSKPDVTMKFIPRKNGAPYNLVAGERSFVVSTLYNQYEFLLNPILTESNSRIDFHLFEGNGDVWLDDIEIVEVDVLKTDPDKYIRFEYNATKNDKKINLSADYVDVKGIPVSGSITLKPFSSILLFKLDSAIVTLNTFTVNAGADKSIICGGSVQFDKPITNYSGLETLTYAWLPTEGLSASNIAQPTVKITSDKTYTLSISTPNGTFKKDSVKVSTSVISFTPSICAVTVNENSKNVIVWQQEPGMAIDSFYIYRESSTQSAQYDLMGKLPYSATGVYVDLVSDAHIKSNSYKIAVNDLCGFLTDKSSEHKTIHLTIYKGTGNNLNLVWEKYFGSSVSNYKIYRGTTKSNLVQIGISSGSNPAYTDETAPTGDVYYQIEGVFSQVCSSLISTGYENPRSNIMSNADVLSAITSFPISEAFFYPNPAFDKLNIINVNSTNATVIIFSLQGKQVLNKKIGAGEIDISKLPKETYIVKLIDSNDIIINKLVKL